MDVSLRGENTTGLCTVYLDKVYSMDRGIDTGVWK